VSNRFFGAALSCSKRRQVKAGFLHKGKIKLGDLVDQLKKTYCGSVGIEYMHLTDREQLNWIRERVERTPMIDFTAKHKEIMYRRLAESDLFERFLATKFANGPGPPGAVKRP
jgi:2-oxoglutarate dehydrogenase complex dehydrogenase (E1) component-like enzyme